MQDPDVVHALGEELALMFETGERESKARGAESGCEQEMVHSDDWQASESEEYGEVTVKPTTKKTKRARNATVKSLGTNRPFTRSRRRSMEQRSESTGGKDEAESRAMLTSSLGRE